MPLLKKTAIPAMCAVTLCLQSQNCPAKEKYPVTVSYVLKPANPLPERIGAVAVIDAGVEAQDAGDRDARRRKWAAIGAEMIEAMLQSVPPEAAGRPLTVVQRRATKKILEEQDLQLAGIVQGDTATRVGQLLAVQGLIMSTIGIQVDTRRQEKSVVDWTQLFGVGGAMLGRPPGPRGDPRFRHRPGGPSPRNPYCDPYERRGGGMMIELPTRTISEISRSLTVQCSFALVDATNGQSVVQIPPRLYQKTDKAKPDFLFGGCVEEADLDPVDHFIGELVERAARDFVGQIAPVRVSYTYDVIGKGKYGEAAVRALRADDYPAALAAFEAAHRDDPERDWHVFGMAVTCELMGDPARALHYYRQAASMPDVDEDDLPIYLAAKERLTAHVDRILTSPRPAEAKSPPRREQDKKRDKSNDEEEDDDD